MATLYGKPPEYCSSRKRAIVHKSTEPKVNSTDKADANYLNALKDGPMTVKQLAEAAHKTVATVQRQVRVMEKRGLIKHCGTIKTKANPPILWGLA
jgi:predicted Rossmann fold nucleotide-binding protein DprA/Smf involved in DNA uptake